MCLGVKWMKSQDMFYSSYKLFHCIEIHYWTYFESSQLFSGACRASYSKSKKWFTVLAQLYKEIEKLFRVVVSSYGGHCANFESS